MPESVKRHGPVLAVSLLLLVLIREFYLSVLDANDGRLVYALDDAYIHMAMAKNLVVHGVFGVTPEGFTAANSSIIWPLLLAMVYYVFDPNEWAPLVLNAVFAIAAVGALGHWLRRAGLHAGWILAFLLAAVFFGPVVSLVFCGMEHSLQVFLSLLFAGSLWQALRTSHPPGGQTTRLLVVGALLTACRYEGLFLVAMACLVLYMEKRRGLAAALGAAACVPVVIFAAVSAAKGWYVLPNSVLIKGAMPDFTTSETAFKSLGLRSIGQLFEARHLLVLAGAAALLIVMGRRSDPTEDRSANKARDDDARGLRPLLLVYLGTTLMHLQFAGLGWFLRYDAYLVCLGVMMLGLALALRQRPRPANWYETSAAVVLLLVLLFPLVERGVWSMRHLVPATRNIYQQHYQMASFLERHYPEGRVALNDIGAVSYLTDTHLFDVAGLANMDVARIRRSRERTAEDILRLTRQDAIRIAVVYDRVFIPQEWIEVARWHISGNVACAGETVSFFAVDPDARDELVANLRAFAPSLPPEVGHQIAGDLRAP